MHTKRTLASLTTAMFIVLLALATIGPVNPSALAGISSNPAHGGAGTRTSAPSALAAGLVISGPVTLEYSASTSDSDSCTGQCTERLACKASYTSYSRTADGTLASTVNFTVDNGTTRKGTGRLNEP